MGIALYGCDPDRLSRLELVSLYINGYYQLDSSLRSRFEAAFRKRKLPVPDMPSEEPVPRSVPENRRAIASGGARRATIDRDTFLSYILLIYTGTAVFYSWIYLALRLLKMDFRENAKHKLIQSGIALFYVIAEILLYDYFSKAE
jgi:hypothetical protein